MRNHHFIIALFLMTALLAACGGAGAAPAAGTQDIQVDMHDIYYGDSNDNVNSPPVWTVTSGQQVTVHMDNEGTLEHTFVILKAGEEIPANFREEEDGDKVLFSSGLIPSKEMATTTFTAPAPGEYNVICTVLGHSGLMHGRLVVKEP